MFGVIPSLSFLGSEPGTPAAAARLTDRRAIDITDRPDDARCRAGDRGGYAGASRNCSTSQLVSSAARSPGDGVPASPK